MLRSSQALIGKGLTLMRIFVDFVVDYASFLAKTVTLVIAIVVVLVAIASMRGKGRRKSSDNCRSPGSMTSIKACANALSSHYSTRSA